MKSGHINDSMCVFDEMMMMMMITVIIIIIINVVIRMVLPQLFVNYTLPHGQTMEFPSSQLLCWLSTGNSAAMTLSHRQAPTSSTAARASVARGRSSRLITYWSRRRPRASLTCFTVYMRWDALASVWFRLRCVWMWLSVQCCVHFYLSHQRWWEVMFLPLSLHIYIYTLWGIKNTPKCVSP